jgi:single-stranded-DNA-specific exonuclease
MQKYWDYVHVDYDAVKRLAGEIRVPLVIARILFNHGYINPEEANKFLYPSFDDLYDPFLMKGMETAVNRILQAISNHEKICIYGDYDVDGVTSILILKDLIMRLGGKATYSIPKRLDEGYGLNFQKMEDIIASGEVKLIVTVDTGITSVEEAKYLRDAGIDLIITDHHEQGNEDPIALTILDPKQSGCKYPFKELAGVGVIFKLAQAISSRQTSELPLLSYLKIAAIGTIADLVPLIDENRIISSLGLKELKETANLGLKMLLQELRMDDHEIESSEISFRLGPRINALGRLGDVEQAVELFFTSNRAYAKEIINEMERLNVRRQKLENAIYDTVIEAIEADPENENLPILVVEGQDWHLGVIGIVASRLANQYYKPALVISVINGVGKASGRSIPDFDLKSALDGESDLLESFGGHKMAVGFQIKQENLLEFKKRISSKVSNLLDGRLFIRSDKIDADISLPAINPELMHYLDLLKPWGHSNPKPIFCAKGVSVQGAPILLKDKHLKLKLNQYNRIFDGICWKHSDWKVPIENCTKMDIIFQINRSYWNYEETIQLDIQDFNPTEF